MDQPLPTTTTTESEPELTETSPSQPSSSTIVPSPSAASESITPEPTKVVEVEKEEEEVIIKLEPVSLETDLKAVVAGFGSWWGKVKDSTVKVYETSSKQIDQLATTARADLSPLLAKTKANLDSFSETAKAELIRLNEASKLDVNDRSDGMFVGADGNVVFIPTSPIITTTSTGVEGEGEVKEDVKGKGVDRTDQDGTTSNEPTPAAQASAFFSKIQSQLASNPNLKELSKNLTTLQHSVQNNLSTLPSSLTTNLHSLQSQLATLDLNSSTLLAEEFVLKGENWMLEMGAEVTRLAKEAVTVLPPTSSSDGVESRNKRKEERMKEAEQVAVGRKESLLMRLRSDASSILLVDPSIPSPTSTESSLKDTTESYTQFLAAIETTGGIEGTTFTNRIQQELNLTTSGVQLKKALEVLVPSSMTVDTFWCRYFFRVGQIEEDEVRRRRVLEVAASQEEDFSWDADEEEEDESESTPIVSSTTLPLPTTSSTLSTPTTEEIESTRRESSEATNSTASYDIVGIKSGEGSEIGDAVAVKDEVKVEKEPVVIGEKKEDSGEDSDWE